MSGAIIWIECTPIFDLRPSTFDLQPYVTNDDAIILDRLVQRFTTDPNGYFPFISSFFFFYFGSLRLNIFGEVWQNLPEVPDKHEIMPPGKAVSDSDVSRNSGTGRLYGTSLSHMLSTAIGSLKPLILMPIIGFFDAITYLGSSVAMFKAHPFMDNIPTWWSGSPF